MVEFEIGEIISYAPYGIGVLRELEKIILGEEELTVLVIDIHQYGKNGRNKNICIKVPVSGAGSSFGLRKLATPALMQEAIQILGDVLPTSQCPKVDKRRIDKYNYILSSGDLLEIAKILNVLHSYQHIKILPNTLKNVYQQMLFFIIVEYAAIMHMPEHEEIKAEQYLLSVLDCSIAADVSTKFSTEWSGHGQVNSELDHLFNKRSPNSASSHIPLSH